jgi:hypothetical protein
MSITKEQRSNAIKDFMFHTDFKGDSGSTKSKTVEELQRFADERGIAEKKKRE